MSFEQKIFKGFCKLSSVKKSIFIVNIDYIVKYLIELYLFQSRVSSIKAYESVKLYIRSFDRHSRVIRGEV